MDNNKIAPTTEPELPAVVTEALKYEKHLSPKVVACIKATPWFFRGTTFELLPSGVLKIVYFVQKSDVDHWYRKHLMWREETSHKWRVDKVGRYPSLAKAKEAIDARLAA